MFTVQQNRVFALSLSLYLGTASADAGESFRDEFDTPGTPVTWRQLGDEMTIADGQLVFGESGYLAGVAVNEFTARNLAVEAKFQILSGSQGGVFLRDDGTGFAHYFANIRVSDHINYQRRADIWRADSVSSSTPLTEFTEVSFDPDGVVVMRLEAIDDNLSLWVWPAGTDRPQEPFLTAQDATFTDGEVGLFVVDYPDSQLARLAVDYFEVEVFTIPGDYNGNGVVDAADYTVWRDLLGQSVAMPNESVTLGSVSPEDYDVWKAHYGETAGSGAGQASSPQEGIPEPASLVLVMLATAWLLARPRAAAKRSC